LSALCIRTGLKKSASSRQVEALVARGFLERCEVDLDRRAVALHISATLAGRLCSDASMRAIFPGNADHSMAKADFEMMIAALRRLSEFTRLKAVPGRVEE
jgi:DNA-binding Lrp family transcriptional regulator